MADEEKRILEQVCNGFKYLTAIEKGQVLGMVLARADMREEENEKQKN